MRYNSLFYISFVMMTGLCSATGAEAMFRNKPAFQDSVVVAQKIKMVELRQNKTVSSINLNTAKGRRYFPGGKYCLLLKEVVQLKEPEGVYEIYLSAKQPSQKDLQPGKPGFVNVLDLFTPMKNGSVKIDIGGAVKNIVRKNKFADCWVTVLFRGNELPNKQQASNAGHLRFKSISLLRLED